MPQNVSQMLSQAVLIVPLVGIMIWMFLSQRKKSKAVKEMISSIQPGANVKTIGGFYGKIIAVKEDVVTIECGPDKVKLVLDKNAVATVESSDTVNESAVENIKSK